MAVGGLSGLAGAGIGHVVAGAVGTIGFAGGALTGASGGFAGGFVGGAGNAWVGGASFQDGLKSGLVSGGIGAATGGLVGGISGGITASKNGGNFWSGKGDYIFESVALDDSYLGGEFYNDDETVHQMLKSENGWTPGKHGIDDISVEDIYMKVHNGNEYIRGTDGIIYRYPEGGGATKAISGYTYVNKQSIFQTNVKIHMSPHVSMREFNITLNHEFIHAYHRVSGMANRLGGQFKNYTETSAYTYSSQFRPVNAAIGLQTYQYSGPFNIYNWPNYLILIK